MTLPLQTDLDGVKVALGLLSPAEFCNGHNYFVQQMPQQLQIKPYLVHCTHQFSGPAGKRQRLRDWNLWLADEDDYYSKGKLEELQRYLILLFATCIYPGVHYSHACFLAELKYLKLNIEGQMQEVLGKFDTEKISDWEAYPSYNHGKPTLGHMIDRHLKVFKRKHRDPLRLEAKSSL